MRASVRDDQEQIADRVVVMRAGAIEQVGTPDEVYHAPATPFVYEFLGDVNQFDHEHVGYARPHEIHVELDPTSHGSIPVKVEHVAARGAVVRVELSSETDAKVIEADLTHQRLQELALVKGQRVFARPIALRIFEAQAAAE